MIGIASRSAGVVLIPKTDKPGEHSVEYSIWDVVNGIERDSADMRYLYSTIEDWEEIEAIDIESLLGATTQEWWLSRTVSHLRLAIAGLDEQLERTVLEETEEIIGSHVCVTDILDRLLVAPLADPKSPNHLALSALSHGFSAVATILDDLVGLQPLVHKLTDHWLNLPEALFTNLPVTKGMIWITVVEKVGLRKILDAQNKHNFQCIWNLSIWEFTDNLVRNRVNQIGKELSCHIYPGSLKTFRTLIGRRESDNSSYRNIDVRMRSNIEAFESAQKQISAILRTVALGNELKSREYLQDLIRQQTAVSGGKKFAIKSLCKIAQGCSVMFRTDFEEICLKEALQLIPTDGWTLIQLGDHLKRTECYPEALEVLRRAQESGENVIGKSSVADVFSRQGDYEKAIETYQCIEDWNEIPEVLTGIADNLRRMGRMDESATAYRKLIERTHQGHFMGEYDPHRAQVGLAEIAKRQGNYQESLKLYRQILDQKNIEEKDKLYYRLGFCYVLKVSEDYEEAYKVISEVIQEYPFAMEARFTRGSILGLIGRETEGLEDLPESSGSRSWREWLRPFYRGLLLLKLKKYSAAQKNLVEELDKAIATGEEKPILRMAAALWFLIKDETREAEGILSEIPALHDCHVQYLHLVFKLHAAQKKQDADRIACLKKQIQNLRVVDTNLDKAVIALDRGDFASAIAYETEALLRFAA